MFCINPAPVFNCEVPLSRAGLNEPIYINVTFRYKTRDQLAAWVLRSGNVEDVQLLDEIIEKWSGLQDADGNAVPYSLTSLSTLLANFTPARGEFFAAYLSELTDTKKDPKRKNS